MGTIRTSLAVELYVGTDVRAAWRLSETLTVALFDTYGATHQSYLMKWSCLTCQARGGELGILRVREHPLSAQMRPLTAKSNHSKWKKMFINRH